MINQKNIVLVKTVKIYICFLALATLNVAQFLVKNNLHLSVRSRDIVRQKEILRVKCQNTHLFACPIIVTTYQLKEENQEKIYSQCEVINKKI